eukprot:794412-Pelagomonas_calceolata.AAC.1
MEVCQFPRATKMAAVSALFIVLVVHGLVDSLCEYGFRVDVVLGEHSRCSCLLHFCVGAGVAICVYQGQRMEACTSDHMNVKLPEGNISRNVAWAGWRF